jgi:putative transposase
MGLSGRAEGQQNQTVMLEASQHRRERWRSGRRTHFEGRVFVLGLPKSTPTGRERPPTTAMEGVPRQQLHEGDPMRRSRFTENEILHLLYEASAGVSVAEICSTAGVSLRTFYRWRRRFGGLNVPAVMQMKDLAAENLRLRGLVSNLVERLRTPAEPASPEPTTTSPTAPPVRDKAREQRRAIEIAAEKCGGALTGRFASVRVNP